MKAHNVNGDSAASSASSAVSIATTVPDAPINASATQSGATGAAVSWAAPVDNGGLPIDKYTVTASPGGTTCTWTSGPLTCTVPGLTKGVQYTFTGAAHNANGYGASSVASNAVLIAPTVPDAPTGVSASLDAPAATSTSVTVSWTAPNDNGGSTITKYTVTASNGGGICTWTTGPLQCTVSGLAKGTAYTFTVTATNSVGAGAASAASNSVTTGTTVPGAPQRGGGRCWFGQCGGVVDGTGRQRWAADRQVHGDRLAGRRCDVHVDERAVALHGVGPDQGCAVHVHRRRAQRERLRRVIVGVQCGDDPDHGAGCADRGECVAG